MPRTTHSQLLPYLMNRVVSLVNAPMQAELRQRGMTMTHWRILGFLDERDGLIISDLAERTMTDHATLSRALDRLEERGLVLRKAVASDGRRFEIHLRPKGRALYRELAAVAKAIEQWAFAGMDPADRKILETVLGRMSATLAERSDGEPVQSWRAAA